LVALFTLLVWSALWGTVAYHFNSALDEWIVAQKTQGTVIEYADRRTDGTPFSVHVHLSSFHAQAGESYLINAGEAVLHLNLWDWGTVSTKLKNGIKGRILGADFLIEAMKFIASRPEYTPFDYSDTGLNLWVQALDLTPQTDKSLPLGKTVREVSFDMRVMGVVPDFTKIDEVKKWNDASGVFEFDDLNLAWGPLSVSAKGTVALDAALQAEGAFSGRVEGLNDAIELLATHDVLNSKQIAMLKSSLAVLSRPSGLTGDSYPIVPITIQEGGLFVGPVRLMNIPKIEWPPSP